MLPSHRLFNKLNPNIKLNTSVIAVSIMKNKKALEVLLLRLL